MRDDSGGRSDPVVRSQPPSGRESGSGQTPAGPEQSPPAGPQQYPPQGNQPPGSGGYPPAPPAQQPGSGQGQRGPQPPHPSYPQGPDAYRTGPSGPRAGFWQRLGAFLIDGLIISVGMALVLGLLAAITFPGVEMDSEGNVVEGGGRFATFITVASLLPAIASVLYFAFGEGGAAGQTIGKRALGIRVIRFNTGGPLGFGLALGRTLARILSSFLFNLGYLWMLWDQEKQTWHDKLASTVVVPTSSYPVPPR